MPTLTRWYLKTALLYLAAALLSGAVLALRGLVQLGGYLQGLSPVYFHLFMVGWVTQLIFGIVYWLFPVYSKERPRGHDWLGWTTYGLLNAGLLLRALSEPMNALEPGQAWGWLLAISAGAQWLAGLAFFLNTWPRVHAGPRRGRRES
jgi:hypothetical protein